MRRACPLCGATMAIDPGSDRTVRGKVWFRMRCAKCGHVELDHTTRETWRRIAPRQ